jgi:hypothetical protein
MSNLNSMKRQILILVLSLSSLTLIAQKYDYTWVLGYWPMTGSDPDSNIGFTIIPFEAGLENMYYKLGLGSMSSTNAQICNPETGELLFYFDGCRVFNREFEIMENGDSIFHGPWWTEWCETGTKSYTLRRNGVVLPVQGNGDEYYLIHMRDTIFTQYVNGPIHIYNRQMNYSIIDFENNLMGQVVQKSNPVYVDSTHPGFLHTVKHNNENSWWVISFTLRNELLKVIAEQDTVYLYDYQKVIDIPRLSVSGGHLRFDPEGSKMSLSTRWDGVFLFDFDRNNGNFSNMRVWNLPDTNFTFQVVTEFSPNSRYLYVSNMHRLWQIDTWSEDLNAATVLLGEWDGFTVGGFFVTSFCDLLLAPDCKIYMGTCGTTKFLHVIHHPDLPGPACGFEQRGVNLVSVNGFSMPLLPNYRLDTGPVCDPSLATSTASPLWVETVELHIRPNPASGEVWVSLPESPPGGRLSVYDMAGREVYHHTWPGEEHTLHVGGWLPGLYFLNYYSPEGKYASGKLVVK